MGKHLKLIWDFRGPAALQTAKHHVIHLNEYIDIEKITLKQTGIEEINEMHTIAYMIIEESMMKPIRDALKPHRGQWYEMP